MHPVPSQRAPGHAGEGLNVLTAVLLALVVVVGFPVGGASGLMIAVPMLAGLVLVLITTGSHLALGIYCGMRAWRSGRCIWVDQQGALLRDSEGRQARLDRTQSVASFGKPPFEVCILHGTAPDGWRAAWRVPDLIRRLGFGQFTVLDAIGRDDLVVPLVFTRGRGLVVRPLRRYSFVWP